jgi:hypothetical protein
MERELTEAATKYSYEARSSSATSTGLIRMVRPGAGLEQKATSSFAASPMQ